jgi:hypothetical protein
MARWQNIRTVDDLPAWVSPTHAGVIRRAAKEIRGRCDATTYLDTARNMLCFGYDNGGDPRIVFDIPLYRDPIARAPMSFDPVLDATSVDDVIRTIRLARVPAETKEKWAAEHKKSREHDEAQASMVANEAAAKEAMAQTEHQYNKHAIGKHYRKTVVMS